MNYLARPPVAPSRRLPAPWCAANTWASRGRTWQRRGGGGEEATQQGRDIGGGQGTPRVLSPCWDSAWVRAAFLAVLLDRSTSVSNVLIHGAGLQGGIRAPPRGSRDLAGLGAAGGGGERGLCLGEGGLGKERDGAEGRVAGRRGADQEAVSAGRGGSAQLGEQSAGSGGSLERARPAATAAIQNRSDL